MANNIPAMRPALCLYYPNEWGFELVEDHTVIAFGGGAHTIPAGFWFNGASIPAAFWQLTYSPYHPIILPWALAHDWFYCSHVVTREAADETLCRGIISMGGSEIKADLIKAAVSNFGGMYWDDSREDKHYMRSLRQRIINSGRNPMAYGLS